MRVPCLAFMAVAAVVAHQPAAADTVTNWWEAANRYYNIGQGTPGPRTVDMERASTRTALAMFEAVNAIDRRYQSYLGFAQADPAASQDAAAATAAYRILVHHYPAHKAALDESYQLSMAGIGDAQARDRGREVGERAAQAAIGAGGVDPAIAALPYRPRTAPSQWTATALPSLDSYWRAMKPWALPNADALRPPPPPPLASERYARDYEEVRRLGGRASKERTAEQTLIARFRQGPDISPTIRRATDAPGRRQVDNARLLTLYQMAFDDAVQSMVVAKQYYEYWRPITAIRNGDKDDNPATELDPAWIPLLPTPNFQEYPCGHCTVAAATAEVMKREGGLPANAQVDVASMTVPNGVIQRVQSWDQFVREVSDGRMFGGVHYRFSNEAGEEIGRAAARIVIGSVLKPLKTDRR